MPIYSFRITYEDDESIFRDIQIKPSQTANELNNAIVAAYKIKNNYSPALFISNDGWKKVQLLNGIIMNGVADNVVKDKPASKGKGKTKTKVSAKKKKEEPVVATPKAPDTSLKLFDIINDPHQKLIAEYEGSNEYLFHIELLNINTTEDKNATYPLCSKSVGPSPFQNDDLRKYLDSRSKGEGEEYALDKEDDDTDEMGVESEGEASENGSEDSSIDSEIADEFGTDSGFEDIASDE